MSLNNITSELADQKIVEAEKWLSALQLDPKNKELKKKFADWLALDAENESVYLDHLIMLDNISIAFSESASLVNGFPRNIHQEKSTKTSVIPITPKANKKSIRKPFKFLAIAASIFFIAVLTGLMNQWTYFSNIPNADLHTSTAEHSQYILSDGSIVHMNVKTALNTDFGMTRRHLELLTGEVFFEVAKDAKRPFIVNIGEMQITALGTAFNIDTSDDWSQLQLTHGSISAKFSNNKTTNILSMGQQIRWRNDNGAFVISDHYLKKNPNWMRGILRVNEMPLSKVLAQINDHYSVRLQLIDPRKNGLLVTGTLPLDDLNGLKVLLKEVLDLQNSQVFNNILFY